MANVVAQQQLNEVAPEEGLPLLEQAAPTQHQLTQQEQQEQQEDDAQSTHSEDGDVCRICRMPAEDGNPLFHPCKCSGSIRFVHQQCLMDWLKHSGNTHCEVCKHKICFTPVYAKDAPATLPWHELLFGLIKLALRGMGVAYRIWVVCCLWLVMVPWFTSMAWRLAFLRSFSEVPQLVQDRFNLVAVTTDCLQGSLLSLGIVFLNMGFASLKDYLRTCIRSLELQFVLREAAGPETQAAPAIAQEVAPLLLPTNDAPQQRQQHEQEGEQQQLRPLEQQQQLQEAGQQEELQQQEMTEATGGRRDAAVCLEGDTDDPAASLPAAAISGAAATAPQAATAGVSGQQQTATAGPSSALAAAAPVAEAEPAAASSAAQSVAGPCAPVVVAAEAAPAAPAEAVPAAEAPAAAPAEAAPAASLMAAHAAAAAGHDAAGPPAVPDAPAAPQPAPVQADAARLVVVPAAHVGGGPNQLGAGALDVGGHDDHDAWADLAFDELVGLQGPWLNFLETIVLVMIGNAFFMALVVYVPLNLGRVLLALGQHAVGVLSTEQQAQLWLSFAGMPQPLLALMQLVADVLGVHGSGAAAAAAAGPSAGSAAAAGNASAIAAPNANGTFQALAAAAGAVYGMSGTAIDRSLADANGSGVTTGLAATAAATAAGLSEWVAAGPFALSALSGVADTLNATAAAVTAAVLNGTGMAVIQDSFNSTDTAAQLLQNSSYAMATNSSPAAAPAGAVLAVAGPPSRVLEPMPTVAVTFEQLLQDLQMQVELPSKGDLLALSLGHGLLLTVAMLVLYVYVSVRLWRAHSRRARRHGPPQLLKAVVSAGRWTLSALSLLLRALKLMLLLALELGAFPLCCGAWLDLCALPLSGSTVQQRLALFAAAPGLTGLVHWVLGVGFMLGFTFLVCVAREVLRPGALPFLKDPTNPERNPIREMLDEPLGAHLARVGLSGLVYACLCVVLVHLPALLATTLLPGLFPLQMQLFDPLTQIPADMLLFHVFIPFTVEHVRIRAAVRMGTKQWLRLVGRVLGLSAYLLPPHELLPAPAPARAAGGAAAAPANGAAAAGAAIAAAPAAAAASAAAEPLPEAGAIAQEPVSGAAAVSAAVEAGSSNRAASVTMAASSSTADGTFAVAPNSAANADPLAHVHGGAENDAPSSSNAGSGVMGDPGSSAAAGTELVQLSQQEQEHLQRLLQQHEDGSCTAPHLQKHRQPGQEELQQCQEKKQLLPELHIPLQQQLQVQLPADQPQEALPAGMQQPSQQQHQQQQQASLPTPAMAAPQPPAQPTVAAADAGAQRAAGQHPPPVRWFEQQRSFPLQLFGLAALWVVSMVAINTLLLTQPVLLGRAMFTRLALPLRNDLYTGAAGFLALWLACSFSSSVLSMASARNARAMLHAAWRWALLGAKVGTLAALWLGLVATMLGVLCELVLLPLRLPANQTAIIFLHQDWTMGVLALKLWHLGLMLGPRREGADDSWRSHFEALQRNGLRNLDFKRALTKIVLPVAINLGTCLALPYVLTRGLLPLLPLPAAALRLANVWGHAGCMWAYLVWLALKRLRHAVGKLHNAIRDDKYLVGRELINFSPAPSEAATGGPSGAVSGGGAARAAVADEVATSGAAGMAGPAEEPAAVARAADAAMGVPGSSRQAELGSGGGCAADASAGNAASEMLEGIVS